MQLRFVVNNLTPQTVMRPAKLEADGRDVMAGCPGILVELLPIGGGRTLTLEAVVDDREAEMEKFAEGNTIIVTFEKEEAQ